MRRLQGEHDGSNLRIGVVVSRFNESVTEALLKGALEVSHVSNPSSRCPRRSRLVRR